MGFVDIVPERFHGITKEFAKFGTIGVVNLIINFAVSNVLLLTALHGSEVKAKAVATIVATTCAYVMNRHWTYRDRPKSTLRREYTLFFFFNLIGLFIETGAVAFTKYGLHQTHIVAFNISTAVGIGLGTIFRFWAYRTHVFKVDPAAPAGDQLAEALADAPPEVVDDARPTTALQGPGGPGRSAERVAAGSRPVASEPSSPTNGRLKPVAGAAPPPRLVVSSVDGGSVVIKVVAATTDTITRPDDAVRTAT